MFTYMDVNTVKVAMKMTLNNAMGGKPWQECSCGIDENGNLPRETEKLI
jgi:hypothetical protein